MNKNGREFINKINEQYSKIPDMYKRKFSQSEIIERVMRLGVEARLYDLDVDKNNPYTLTDDLVTIAIATLKKDIIDIVRRDMQHSN